MWAPALAALLVTAVVIGVVEHRELRLQCNVPDDRERPVLGLGLVAIVLATGWIVATHSPALGVAAIGLVAAGVRVAQRKDSLGRVTNVLGVHLLVGLFGIAVALGTLGRDWLSPAHLLSHLGLWATAGVAALTSVVVNNLPAASLLAARTPPHPFALLVGLNLGPNLFVTGSLAWMLWFRTAKRAGANPSLKRASRLGVIAVPLSMVAALALLASRGLS
jgi:arsenical pump membrane protein